MIVRSRSALGLKYLEIDKGTSNQGYPEGSVLPLKAAHPKPVEIDQVLNTSTSRRDGRSEGTWWRSATRWPAGAPT